MPSHISLTSCLRKGVPIQSLPGSLQVSPEFSIRLMDETYAKENATIQKVL